MSSELARRVARRRVYPAVEHTWAAGAWLAGRFVRAAANGVETSPGTRALIVAPHPDDETVGAGGVAALHASAGDSVTVLVVTDGGASRAASLPAIEIATRRRAELDEAVAILGVRDVVCLGRPEGRWQEPDTARAMRPFVEAAEILYAPSCVDFHPEHVAVARVVSDLVRPDQVVRVYELGVPLTPVLANRTADIRAVADVKAEALRAFRTQELALVAVERWERYRRRFYGSPTEAFWELRGDAYARVMRIGDWRGGRSPFRGVRGRPFTDPLAAVVGVRERLALRRAAGAVAG